MNRECRGDDTPFFFFTFERLNGDATDPTFTLSAYRRILSRSFFIVKTSPRTISREQKRSTVSLQSYRATINHAIEKARRD